MTRRSLLPALLMLSACEDPLKEAQRLQEPRVLGVRLSSGDDRAELSPEAPAQLEFLLAGPAGPVAEARVAYALCVAADTERGVPRCSREPFASGSAELDGGAIAFDAPAGIAAGTRLALLGVICLRSEPELASSPLDWRCSDGGEPLRLSFDARMAGEELANRNPDLSALSIRVGGVAIPPEAAGVTPGCGAGATTLDRQQASSIEVELGELAREPARGAFAGESLQLSHFASDGRLQRHYSFIAPGEAPATALRFEPPSNGGPLKQYLVVRDDRGGVSWASFSFCVE